MPDESARTASLEVRVAPDILGIVERAAEIQGRSVSDFVAAAAHEAARRTIDESHLIRLSVEDQGRFADLLLHPPEPTDALRRASEAHGRLVQESR